MLIYLPVTSRPLISLQKESVLLPCNFAAVPLTACILNLYLPLTSRPMKRRTLSQRPVFEAIKSVTTTKTVIPATEPPDPRRVFEGFLKGSLKGSLKGFEGSSYLSAEGLFRTPSKSLREPFENPFQKVSKSRMRWASRGLKISFPGSRGPLAGNESLEAITKNTLHLATQRSTHC